MKLVEIMGRLFKSKLFSFKALEVNPFASLGFGLYPPVEAQLLEEFVWLKISFD
jgi:hypothetical protein